MAYSAKTPRESLPNLAERARPAIWSVVSGCKFSIAATLQLVMFPPFFTQGPTSYGLEGGISQKQNGSNFGSKNCVSPWSPSPLIWGDEGGDCPRAPRNQCFHIVFPPLAQTRTDLLCLFSCSETSTCSKMNAHQAAGGDPCGSIPLGPTSIPLPEAFRCTCPVNVTAQLSNSATHDTPHGVYAGAFVRPPFHAGFEPSRSFWESFQ